MSLAGEVRKILQAGPADFETLALRLDLAKMDRAGRGLLRSTLSDLREAEMVTLEPKEPGRAPEYRLMGRTGLPGETQAKMRRAVRLKGGKNRPITCKDVAALSGCTQEYAARYLRFLKEQGYLLQGTAVKLSRFGLGLAYRVAPGREKEKPPWWNRRAEEERKSRDQGLGVRGQEEVQKFAANMRQTFADFSQGLRQTLAPYFPQIEPVLLEMEADLNRVMKEQGHGEPADGHH